jgi:hypothetical protein
MYGDVLLLMLLKIDCSPGKLLIVCPDADSARTCHMYIFHAEAPGISRYRIVCSCFFLILFSSHAIRKHTFHDIPMLEMGASLAYRHDPRRQDRP